MKGFGILLAVVGSAGLAAGFFCLGIAATTYGQCQSTLVWFGHQATCSRATEVHNLSMAGIVVAVLMILGGIISFAVAALKPTATQRPSTGL
jgi:hypothetical protein